MFQKSLTPSGIDLFCAKRLQRTSVNCPKYSPFIYFAHRTNSVPALRFSPYSIPLLSFVFCLHVFFDPFFSTLFTAISFSLKALMSQDLSPSTRSVPVFRKSISSMEEKQQPFSLVACSVSSICADIISTILRTGYQLLQ